MKPVAVCGIVTGALAVSVAHPTTTPLMAVGAKVAVDAVLGFEVKKSNHDNKTDDAEVEQLPSTEETDEQAAVPEELEEEVHAHLLKEMPDGLPLPNVPRKPNWWEIGWRRLLGRSINDTIWDRWFPPEPSNYTEIGYPYREYAYLGEINEGELERLDGEIKNISFYNMYNAASLPRTNEPNSKETLYNPDGTPKQDRWYGPDGMPVRDRDYNHPGDVSFPHDHLWKDGKRQKDHLPPSPDYKIVTEDSLNKAGEAILIGGTIVGTGYLIYRGVRMLPSLFPPLWWTIPANIAVP